MPPFRLWLRRSVMRRSAWPLSAFLTATSSFLSVVELSLYDLTAPLDERLQEKGIATRPGTHAVHMLGYYRDRFGCKPGDYPGAQLANDCSMAIPLHNRMTADDYAYVVDALRSLG